MIRGLRTHEGGFSLVELMIVMSVTIALLGSALLVFRGRVPRTQFANAINDLSTQLTDISNQVVSGYYPNQNNLRCTVNSSTGLITVDDTGSDSQGRNQDCIYVGQVVHLGSADGSAGAGSCTSSSLSGCDAIDIYTVYGRRIQYPSGALASTLAESGPQITSENKTSYQLGYGTHITNVKVDGVSQPIGGIAFLQSFGGNRDAGSEVPTGAAQVSATPLIGVNIGDVESNFISAINSSAAPAGIYSPSNPRQGIIVCLKSGGSDQYALLTIAKGGVTRSSEVRIVDQAEWSAACI